MSVWTLAYQSFDPAKEDLREALCTLGNGYFATRGAAEGGEAGDIHYPGSYLAGGYNRLRTDIAGRAIENEDPVNMPNWLPLSFRLEGGDWFSVLAVDLLNYRQELGLRRSAVPPDPLSRPPGPGEHPRLPAPGVHGQSAPSRQPCAGLESSVEPLRRAAGRRGTTADDPAAAHLPSASAGLDVGMSARGLHGEAYRCSEHWRR